MNSITNNLSRLQTDSTWIEELGFIEDSGYELSTIYARALASVQRAFKQGNRVDNVVGFSPSSLPPFSTKNKLRITVEILTPQDLATESVTTNTEPVKAGK